MSSRTEKIAQYRRLNNKANEVSLELMDIFQRACTFECYITWDQSDGVLLGNANTSNVAPVEHFHGYRTITQEHHERHCI